MAAADSSSSEKPQRWKAGPPASAGPDFGPGGVAAGAAVVDEEEGEVTFRRRRKLESGDLDITPMIDVTFLLLIFFMVSSTMKEPATVDVPVARHGVGADASDSVIISILRVGGDAAEPLIRLPDGTTHALAELQQSGAVTKLVEAAKSDSPPKTQVLLNADRDLPHRTVREVSQMIGKVEGVRLFLGVQDD